MRFTAIVLYMLFASAAHAAPVCGMSSIGDCGNTNQLVWAESFKPALRSFLDRKTVSWLGQKQDIEAVVEEVLGGAPDNVATVAEGLLRFSAVRHQSATERGAIFISSEGKIEAVGVLHFNCAKRCEKTYSLSILLASENARLVSLVRAWGDEQMQQNAQSGFEDDLTKIDRVEVLTRDL